MTQYKKSHANKLTRFWFNSLFVTDRLCKTHTR